MVSEGDERPWWHLPIAGGPVSARSPKIYLDFIQPERGAKSDRLREGGSFVWLDESTQTFSVPVVRGYAKSLNGWFCAWTTIGHLVHHLFQGESANQVLHTFIPAERSVSEWIVCSTQSIGFPRLRDGCAGENRYK